MSSPDPTSPGFSNMVFSQAVLNYSDGCGAPGRDNFQMTSEVVEQDSRIAAHRQDRPDILSSPELHRSPHLVKKEE
jgi:hypothetical protein